MTTTDVYLDDAYVERSLRADVVAGLTAAPKWLPPKWFYDARGSELFEQITELPEYYPYRAERGILAAHGGDLPAVRTLIELGSGYSTKTRLLIDALAALETYVAMDISASALDAAATRIGADYPSLRVHNVVGDFGRHLGHLPDGPDRLVAFLGGTIGNLEPAERAKFLTAIREVLRPGEHLLLGTDLVKSPRVLVPAYDDAQGVTAEFNRNVLRVINGSLGADFDVDAFSHQALWDDRNEWIEMRLRARWPMRVTIPAVGLVVELATGEEIRTEISAKFRREGVAKELAEAGFSLDQWWTDPEGRFGLSLAAAV
ncbi:L-histidine N(alpha)-methyltransferase [Actinoplanes sp. NPDC048988]|uniref:L-histidine N(alpha)-methyltransferase n=1 Tax=Actinoplanes sp. NPDC048988 TaxID=3363901 RepID=UPI003713E8FB